MEMRPDGKVTQVRGANIAQKKIPPNGSSGGILKRGVRDAYLRLSIGTYARLVTPV
jgi:hypothetical protein